MQYRFTLALVIVAIGAMTSPSAEAAGVQCIVRVPVESGGAATRTTVIEPDGVRVVDEGLFRLAGGRLQPIPVDGGGETGRISRIVHFEEEGGPFILAEKGLFRLAGGRLQPIPVDGGGETGRITWRIEPLEEGERFVGAEAGLFQLSDGRLQPIPVEGGGDTGLISLIWPLDQDERLIRAETGLFRLASGRLHPIPLENGGELGAIKYVKYLGGEHLIQTEDDDLFWLNSGQLKRVVFDRGDTGRIDLGGVMRVHDPFLRAERGLFRLTAERLHRVPVEGGGETGRIGRIEPLEPGEWLIAAETGLFWLADERLHRVPVESGKTGRIWGIEPPEEGGRFIRAETGLFWLTGGRLHLFPVEGGGETGLIWGIEPPEEGGRFIRAETGLFWLTGGQLQPVPAEGSVETGRITLLGPAERGGERFIGADAGLFRLAGGRLHRVAVNDGATGRIFEIGSLEEGKLFLLGSRSDTQELGPLADHEPFIRAETGLFRYVPGSTPDLLRKRFRGDAQTGEEHRFEWVLQHSCVGVFSAQDLLRVVDHNGKELARGRVLPAVDDPSSDEFRVESSVLIELPEGSDLTAKLEFRPSQHADDWQLIAGSESKVLVNWRLSDHARHAAFTLGPPAILAHTAIFAGLLVAARRSRWSWRVLTDPIWGKIGAWSWFALRHAPPLQRWILGRWFGRVRNDLKPPPYLPMPISRLSNESFRSTDVVEALAPGRRVWLQAAPGMGKTALVEEVVARYFGDPSHDALGRAFRVRGYVPLRIALRDYTSVPVPQAAPEEWLFELAARALESKELNIEDRGLLRSILTAGYFVLLLDGANEVNDRGAIPQFAQRYPEVGLLVTSQTAPSVEAADLFELWRLPHDIRQATQPLLALYLGEERGGAVFRSIKDSPITTDIRSGYDVRLVADLIEAGLAAEALPRNRVDLYDAMLGLARSADESDYPLADLCRTAWQVWSEGQRDLQPGGNVPSALIEPLRAKGVRIVRALDGARYQFRHDQMRGYLAARWAVVHEVSPVDLLKDTPGIWRLDRGEQQIVWGFFAELVSPERGLTVLDWAAQEAERAELQVALRRVAQRDGWFGNPSPGKRRQEVRQHVGL